MKNKNNKIQKRTLSGVVVSNKMDKTAVVQVDRYTSHPKYKKRYRISKKYFVDDPRNEVSIGDKITFIETRPLSKNKRWKIKKVN